MSGKPRYTYLQTDMQRQYSNPAYLALTAAERGIYADIRGWYWSTPDSPLIADAKVLAKLCNATKKQVDKSLEKLTAANLILISEEKKQITILELDERRVEVDEIRRKRQEYGRKGGLATHDGNQEGGVNLLGDEANAQANANLTKNELEPEGKRKDSRFEGDNGSSGPPPPGEQPMTTGQVLAHLRTLPGVQDSDIHSWRVQTGKHGWTDENWRMTLNSLISKMAIPDDPVRSIPKYVTGCMLKSNGSGTSTLTAQPDALCGSGYDFSDLKRVQSDLDDLHSHYQHAVRMGEEKLRSRMQGLTTADQDGVIRYAKTSNPSPAELASYCKKELPSAPREAAMCD